MVSIAYFSYTGNTAYVAKLLKNELGERCCETLDLTYQTLNEAKSGEQLVILYAIHAFNPPAPLIKQVKQLDHNKFTSISFIGVGCHEGALNEGSSQQLQSIVKAKGYQLGVNRVIAMPLTFITSFSDEHNQQLIEKMREQVMIISADLKQGITDTTSLSTVSKVVHHIGKVEKQAAKLFGAELYATNACVSCGRCWLECPMQNITPNKRQKPRFHFNCSMCLKCIYDCPKHAIKPRISRFIPIKAGYQLSDVTKET